MATLLRAGLLRSPLGEPTPGTAAAATAEEENSERQWHIVLNSHRNRPTAVSRFSLGLILVMPMIHASGSEAIFDNPRAGIPITKLNTHFVIG